MLIESLEKYNFKEKGGEREINFNSSYFIILIISVLEITQNNDQITVNMDV